MEIWKWTGSKKHWYRSDYLTNIGGFFCGTLWSTKSNTRKYRKTDDKIVPNGIISSSGRESNHSFQVVEVVDLVYIETG